MAMIKQILRKFLLSYSMFQMRSEALTSHVLQRFTYPMEEAIPKRLTSMVGFCELP
jgi:hypothetical protein